MDLLIFILATLGMTNIIVFGSIFEKPRNWVDKVFPYSMLNKLLNCTTCIGFWSGIFLSLVFPFGIHWFIAGCISSIVNSTYSKLETLI